MAREEGRTARLEARIAPQVLETIKRAAELQGRSVSEFVVAAAQAAAIQAMDEAESIHLSVKDQRQFVELLVSPPPMAPAMVRARAAHARLIRDPR